MRVSIDDILVEWDDKKADINLKKHRVAFEDAARVFFDEYRVEQYDDAHSDGEDRWKVIGKVRDILFVVYAERGEVIRLISARKATSYERSIYYDSQEMD